MFFIILFSFGLFEAIAKLLYNIFLYIIVYIFVVVQFKYMHDCQNFSGSLPLYIVIINGKVSSWTFEINMAKSTCTVYLKERKTKPNTKLSLRNTNYYFLRWHNSHIHRAKEKTRREIRQLVI